MPVERPAPSADLIDSQECKRLRQVALNPLGKTYSPHSIKEFLEEKLKRYLKDMARITNCNLHGTILSEVEKALISIVLREANGNQLKTARLLGINRNTLRAKIKEYRIS